MSQNYEVTIKQGDLGPAVRARIVNDSDRQAQPLTGATVTFKLLQLDSTTYQLTEVFEKAGVIEAPEATSGTVRYDWEAGDTDSIGRFMGLFKVVYPGGDGEHYPPKGYIWVAIEDAGPTP